MPAASAYADTHEDRSPKRRMSTASSCCYCPTAVASSLEGAEAVIEAVKGDRPSGSDQLARAPAKKPRRRAHAFRAARIPTYETPEKAVRGFMHMARFSRMQNLLMEVPPSAAENFTPDEATAARHCRQGDGRKAGLARCAQRDAALRMLPHSDRPLWRKPRRPTKSPRSSAKLARRRW